MPQLEDTAVRRYIGHTLIFDEHEVRAKLQKYYKVPGTAAVQIRRWLELSACDGALMSPITTLLFGALVTERPYACSMYAVWRCKTSSPSSSSPSQNRPPILTPAHAYALSHFSLIVYPHTTHAHHTIGQSAARQPGGGGGRGGGASRPTMPTPRTPANLPEAQRSGSHRGAQLSPRRKRCRATDFTTPLGTREGRGGRRRRRRGETPYNRWW